MHDSGKSDDFVVPTKLANKTGTPVAESMEGRRSPKSPISLFFPFAHGIELTELESENDHSFCSSVLELEFCDVSARNRRTRSRVRVARFYSNGSHPKTRTYMDSFYEKTYRKLICQSLTFSP